MAEYDLKPVHVPKIKTKFRTIKTRIPVPQSLPIFKELQRSEPRSMRGQPPIVWHTADNFIVGDKWGNRWIDWSSGVLITNAGHGRREIRQALKDIIDQGLLASYVFVHESRAQLTKMLREISPNPRNYTVFLLSAGSEATENCIKLAKTYALEKYGPQKKYFVSFQSAFHGRTLGAQLAGGMPRLKKWIGESDRSFVQIPFPDGYKNENTSFDLFLKTLNEKGVTGKNIAGVMSESYQGIGPDFFPVEYARKLEGFCREHDIVLCMDEVQSGFGRTGKMFCFEHYGIKPDLIACGKGISSSLPISAVIGRRDIQDLYAPGSMTSTHSGSPLPVAAAIANLKLIKKERLVERAARMGRILQPEIQRIQRKYPSVLGCAQGKGLVAGIQVVKSGTRTPNPDLALKINIACLRKGLLMFAPVGIGGECLKIAPPLTISEAALKESIAVFEEAIDEVLSMIVTESLN
ncbi:MAG: aminotransferase class III-fold pyridoxal phosphate-dependent enzyme [Verrucomicrobia bacterium]|nr:aminotransferase class III-fold pyridoxal phosphate-dependent enzyme [Verrucomicrobiota bacterium]MBU4292224.1 aminotransferase class III-fold pyridoxal phosphate-dependent enzyme [Verrucomicrobiota bacterium]MBU4428611.1 aminotransferase class III-fold pyridoxal phosphate-dependent enzyme [Verrucomicrobiota bacterium]MCG2678390.1 aminotransferase class III-fold pyridoxal phosphate-dependent enzyme [Kiritimatiellia bacterium]